MAILSDKVWARHANPWSGWSRVAIIPVLGLGLYLHSYWILGAAVLWAILNPFVFPVPKSVDNWMSKGVLGEQLYFRDGKRLKKDLPTLLNLCSAPAFAAFLYFGWQQQLVPMILAALLSMVLKFWFVDRMVRLYEESGRRR
jgi:hypothetical protein